MPVPCDLHTDADHYYHIANRQAAREIIDQCEFFVDLANTANIWIELQCLSGLHVGDLLPGTAH